ncbi:hypothetical protein [Bacteroides sedimenti]|uniref:Uncharacterized protein n=1 Tax=Bacteroides sedimenti TaxID=2136147 RepID=A0ABN6Z9U4_9BACE
MNNPVRFIDPDERKIVDAEGKEITHSEGSGWSSNATPYVIEIENCMLLAPDGKAMLYGLIGAEFPAALCWDGTSKNLGEVMLKVRLL